METCRRCLRQFDYSKEKGHSRNLCNSCRSNLKRLRIKEWAVNLKGGCCQKCGYKKCLKALQFHHLDPNKKEFAISHSSTKSYERIQKELDKCILVCANCHAEEHDFEFVSVDYKKYTPPRRKPKPENKPRPRKFEVTKEELYKLVWSMPTSNVAKLFNVSDNAIGKRCKLLGISKPPRGYWALPSRNKPS